jgi:putative transposase
VMFAQKDKAAAKEALRALCDKYQSSIPGLVNLLENGEEDIFAHMDFPEEHWIYIRSTNSLERVNREIKRRSDVVGIFPNGQAVLRLLGMVLIQHNENWMSKRRAYMTEFSLKYLIRSRAQKIQENLNLTSAQQMETRKTA